MNKAGVMTEMGIGCIAMGIWWAFNSKKETANNSGKTDES